MLSGSDSFDGDDEDFLKAALAFDNQVATQTKPSTKRKSFELAACTSSIDTKERSKKKSKEALAYENISKRDPLGLNQLFNIKTTLLDKSGPLNPAKKNQSSVKHTTSKSSHAAPSDLGFDFEWDDNSVLSSALDAFDDNAKTVSGDRENIAHTSFASKLLLPNTENVTHVVRAETTQRENGITSHENGDYSRITSDRSLVVNEANGKYRETPEIKRIARPITPHPTSFSFKKKTPHLKPSDEAINKPKVSVTGIAWTPRKVDYPNVGNFQVTSTPVSKKIPPPFCTPVPPLPSEDTHFKSRISAKLSCFKRNDVPLSGVPNASKSCDATPEHIVSGTTSAGTSRSLVNDGGRNKCMVSPISESRTSTTKLDISNCHPQFQSTQKQCVSKPVQTSTKITLRNTASGESKITETFKASPTVNNPTYSSDILRRPTIPTPPTSVDSSLQMLLVSDKSMVVPFNVSNPNTAHTLVLNTPFVNQTPMPTCSKEWDIPGSKETSVRLSGMGSMQSSTSSRTHIKAKRKRKFPGPAGVLPKLKSDQSLAEMSTVKPAESPRVTTRQSVDIPSSQNLEDRFQEDQWITMRKELEPKAEDILKQFDVASVLRKASKKQLVRGKVPVICVMIDQVNTHNADASVIIKDPSGEMKGTIHRQLVKEYPAELQTGSVLVLRQCGVFSPSTKNHYLNITPKNLVRIYPKQGDVRIQINDFVQDDFVIPEPIAPTALPSPEPSAGQMVNNVRVQGQCARMPFSVIGSKGLQSPMPRCGNPNAQQAGRMPYRNETPQRLGHNLSVKVAQSPQCRPQTPQLVSSKHFVGQPVVSRFSSPPNTMQCRARTFTPNTGRTFTPNAARTFIPRQISEQLNNSVQLDTSNIISKQTSMCTNPEMAARSVSYNKLIDVSKMCESTVETVSTTNVGNSSMQFVWDKSAKVQFSNKITTTTDTSVEQQASVSESSNLTAKLNFSIPEDMDDLLRGLDDEIFSDM